MSYCVRKFDKSLTVIGEIPLLVAFNSDNIDFSYGEFSIREAMELNLKTGKTLKNDEKFKDISCTIFPQLLCIL